MTGAGPDGDALPSPGRPEIALIWAEARGGVIGSGGTMPWHLPEDLRHFRRTTSGSPVVMGRRTWESFPARFRPLPGRTNIVLSRDPSIEREGALRAGSLDEALDLAATALAATAAGRTADGAVGDRADPRRASPHAPGGTPQAQDGGTVWVIGGGAVYREALPRADRLVVTEIDLAVDGDTTAPAIPAGFTRVATDPGEGWHIAASGLRHRVHTYRRA